MPYGQIKVDEITFTNAGVDQTISVSGVVASISGNITATGTISGDVIRGGTLVSGATVTGTAGQFGTITGNTAGFTTVTGTTVTGTTANFVTVSGTTVTGTTAQFTTVTGGTAGFTTITGTTVTGTTANFVTVSGTTVTGNVGNFTTITGGSAGFTTVTGTTITGTTLTVASGTFTGNSTAAAFIPTGSTVPTNGVYLPSANNVAISTNGTGRLFVDSSGRVGVGASGPDQRLVAAGGIASTGAGNFGAGNAAGAYLSYESGGDARLFARSVGTASYLSFWTSTTGSSSEKVRITDTGAVGIGTTSPAVNAHIFGSQAILRIESPNTDARLQLKSSSGTWVVGNSVGGTGNYLSFYDVTTSSERARIDSSGRLLVGTSTATAVTDGNVSAQVEIEGTTTATSAISIIRNSNDTNAGGLIIAKSRGTTAGSNTLVSSGDSLGFIQFQGADGTQKRIGALIDAVADAATGANDLPTRLVFSTTADGASSPTERMRIASTGRITLDVNTSTGGFYISNWSSGVGSSTVKYNTSTGQLTFDSSSRLVKEGITDCLYGINAIKQLQPRIYTRKDGGELEIGFIADEMQAVIPELVPTGPKSAITGNAEDTEDIPIAVNYDKFVAVLTKALQEAITKIEALEAAVTALQQS